MNDPSQWEKLVNAFGWPGAILIVLMFGGWRVWKFAMPILAQMGQSWIDRQTKMAEHSQMMAEKTVEIQDANRKQLEALNASIERLFRTKP